jgi:hypothetical protein
MVLGTVRWETGPHERLPKALKTKLAQEGPPGSSPDQMILVMAGPRARWPMTLKGELENNSRKPKRPSEKICIVTA